MGNSADKQSRGDKRTSGPSANELERLRASKRTVLECLEMVGVPTQDQDRLCKVLVDAGLTDEDKLMKCTATTLRGLGIADATIELIMKGKEKMTKKHSQGKSSSGGATSKSQGPVVNKEKTSIPRSNVVQTKFVKGDMVEHYREADHLLRKGKVVGVHLDDLVNGVYYTILLEVGEGREVQSTEKKLEAPGVWEGILQSQGTLPIFEEGDARYVSPPTPSAADDIL